jgi:hypothetical protein
VKADVGATPKLSEASIYALAREQIESVMRGENTAGMPVETEAWARVVLRKLVKRTPKAIFWAGWGWWIAWLLTVLSIPHAAMGGQWMRMGKSAVLERKLKQQKGGKDS